jgi:ribosomal protein S18 acetylase RimI-like enzyme
MGGGRVKALDDWWRDLLGDPEYSASTIFLAVDVHETIVGVAQCWTRAFLKDLVVSDAWRRKGVGEALLLEVFKAFQRRGSPYLDLKVEIRNPSGAERLYRRVGMMPVQ